MVKFLFHPAGLLRKPAALLRKARKGAEEDRSLEAQPEPEPDPPKNAADCTIFSPRMGIGVLGLVNGLARKSKSAALGV